MSRNLTFLLFSVLLFSACVSNDAQRDFEAQAFRPPSGITQTDAQSNILSTDIDDWRISPLFQGFVEIKPPYPNPVNVGEIINFEIEVTTLQSIAGLDVLVRFDDGTFGNLYSSFDNPLNPGLLTFQVNPILFSPFGTAETARGLSRVYLFDFNQRLISYGDVEIR